MPECFICKTALNGSWNVTSGGNIYEKTGRYLGITDGYFLYSEYPNWVYVYCKNCWQQEILKLSFVQQKISQACNQKVEEYDPLRWDSEYHLQYLNDQDPAAFLRKQKIEEYAQKKIQIDSKLLECYGKYEEMLALLKVSDQIDNHESEDEDLTKFDLS